MAKVIQKKPKPAWRLSSNDITKIKADAVVVGEAQFLDKDSLVTKTLIEKIPMFEIRREEFKRSHRCLDLWSVKHSYLGDTFEYVIHAVLDKGDNEIWVEKMKKLYHRIFTEAESLEASSIALPLLGTGAASFDDSLAVRALVASVLSYSQRGRISIIVVSKEKKLLDETDAQFLYQRRYPEKKKTFVQKGVMFVKELVDVCPHRNPMPQKRNNCHEANIRGKSKSHSGSTDNELRQALEESAREAKEKEKTEHAKKTNKITNPVQRHPRSHTNGYGHKNKSDSNNSFSKEDYELQKAIELSKRGTCSQTTVDPTPTLKNGTSLGDEITCPICLCCVSDPKQLDRCGHLFCRACIDRSFLEHKPVCPSCNMVYGEIRGNQPDGQMDVGFSGEHLPGYEGHGTITITYRFPNGWQKEEHPSPGQPYKGTTRRAYLPANSEGKEILALLKTAFERRLTFTIGRSTTTGMEGVVTWNDIHHKTNVHGGATKFGYPDPTYLSRVRDELASKGVTKSTGNSSSRPRSPTSDVRSNTFKDLPGNIDTLSNKEPKEFLLKNGLESADPSDRGRRIVASVIVSPTENQHVSAGQDSDEYTKNQTERKDRDFSRNDPEDFSFCMYDRSFHEPQHITDTSDDYENPEPDINGGRNRDHANVDSVEDETYDQQEKETDFHILPKNGFYSADPSDGGTQIPACVTVPSTERGHQNEHVPAELDSEVNTRNETERQDEDFSKDDREDFFFSKYDRSFHEPQHITDTSDAYENPEPDINGGRNRDHANVDSVEDETYDQQEKETDFHILPKNVFYSADPSDGGTQIPACVTVPSTERGHQNEHVPAELDSEVNTRNETEGQDEDLSRNDPVDFSLSKYGRSFPELQHINVRDACEDPEQDISGERDLDHSDVDSVKDETNDPLEKETDFQNLTKNGFDSADPSDEGTPIPALDIVPSTEIGRQKRDVSAKQDSDSDKSAHNEDLKLYTKNCIPENIPVKESEIQEKKSIGLEVDENSHDEATPTLKLKCTSEKISRGTGYKEAEENRGPPGEKELLTCSPRSTSVSSLDTNSNSSDSFENIDSPLQNDESFNFVSDSSAFQGHDADNVMEEKKAGEEMKVLSGDSCAEHVEINNLLNQKNVHINGEEIDTGHSFEIIDEEEDENHKREDQSVNTTTNKNGRLDCPLPTSSEEEQTCSLQSPEDSGDRSDGNQDNEHANLNSNTVHDVLSGNQPDGQMDVGFSGEHLPGYEGHGTITITYYFPSGTQGAEHPNPGQPYKGTTRRAYLPDSKEGKDVLKLLRKAFERKLTFTIKPGEANGQEYVVKWNDIHHKTNKDGGADRYGYPDSTYLQGVREELAGKGLTCDAQDDTT